MKASVRASLVCALSYDRASGGPDRLRESLEQPGDQDQHADRYTEDLDAVLDVVFDHDEHGSADELIVFMHPPQYVVGVVGHDVDQQLRHERPFFSLLGKLYRTAGALEEILDGHPNLLRGDVLTVSIDEVDLGVFAVVLGQQRSHGQHGQVPGATLHFEPIVHIPL